jgi:hypothetical protein
MTPAEKRHRHLAGAILLLKGHITNGKKELQPILDRLIAAHAELNQAHPGVNLELHLPDRDEEER